MRSLGTRIIAALAAGLILGALIAAAASPPLLRAAQLIEPVGTLWLNALRMTVIPLVVALLITGIATASQTATSGRLAARALILFAVLLVASAVLGALLTPAALSLWPVDTRAAAAIRSAAQGSSTGVPEPPPLSEWFSNIIPTNPFAVAAEGAMLPLVVFALLFGFAVARIETQRRAALLDFFQGVVDAMLVLVHWVLRLAPVGVFVLALLVGMRGGVAAAGALAHYLMLMAVLGIVICIMMYPLAVAMGRVSLPRFARAAVPAQVVAFSTQSSLASLPAMIDGAQNQLRVPGRVTAIILPLAVSLFRITSPIFNLSVVLFVAHLHGTGIGAAMMVAGVAVAAITSLGVVGLPSQIGFFTTTVPISLVLGVPTDVLPLLLAIEVIPDLFRTVGNVTADLAATVIVGRGEN